MLTNNFKSHSFGLLAALVAPAVAQNGAYFIIGAGMPVALERGDPLLSPGVPSNHVHSVVGGNAFTLQMDFATTQTSTCSTVGPIPDKSNYWMPALYFQDKNAGTFTRVPEKPDHQIYYKYGNNDDTADMTRSEFPQGFRMITGNAKLRADDGSHGTAGSQMMWMCHDGASNPQGIGFPSGFTNCDNYGFAASMRFPSCWNGVDFNADDPLAHMAFPTNQDGIAGCPAGHNYQRFPEIFIEYYLDTTTFNGKYSADEIPWVLAQGDPTGYGFHMDFLNGWEPGKLLAAMRGGCNVGNTADPLDSPQCFGPGSLRTGAEMAACRAPLAVNEDVGLVGGPSSTDGQGTIGGTLPKLPGCNPVQYGPGLASIPGPGCPAGPVAPTTPGDTSSVGTVGATTPTTMVKAVTPSTTTSPLAKKATATSVAASPPTTSSSSTSGGTTSGQTLEGWEVAGCWVDALNPRTLATGPEWWGEAMTSTGCVQHCQQIGKTIAGTENEGQCFCGDELAGGSQAPLSDCNMKCNGDPTQTCGGSARLSIFKKPGSSKKRSHAHHHGAHRAGRRGLAVEMS